MSVEKLERRCDKYLTVLDSPLAGEGSVLFLEQRLIIINYFRAPTNTCTIYTCCGDVSVKKIHFNDYTRLLRSYRN